MSCEETPIKILKTERGNVRTVIKEINSNDRNSGGSTHDFTVQLPEYLENVVECKLLEARVPPLFNIDSTNNVLRFEEDEAQYAATITAGSYAVETGTTTLLAAIVTAMDAVAPGNTYAATYNNQTGALTISRATGANAWSLRWTVDDVAGKLADMLGFDRTADNTGATTYTGSGLDIALDKLFLYINEFGRQPRSSAKSNFHYSFGLPLVETANQNKNVLITKEQLVEPPLRFYVPLTLTTISPVVRDAWGHIKNFQGFPFSFTLEFTTLVI